MKKLIAICALTLSVAAVANAEAPKTAPAKGEFGNSCAYGLTTGKIVPTDCKVNWTDAKTKKTYCFSTEASKNEWAKDAAKNEVKAAQEYTHLSKAPATTKTTMQKGVVTHPKS